MDQKANSDLNYKYWTKPICGSCLTQLAHQIAIRSTDKKKIQIEIMRETFKLLSDISKKSFTTELSSKIIQKIEELTGTEDPYIKEKKTSNDLMLKLEQMMRDSINKAKDDYGKFYNSVLITIFGNLIDFATGYHEIDLSIENLEKKLIATLNLKPAIDHIKDLYDLIITGNKNVMYLLDNTGEIVCDKILIEKLANFGNQIKAIVKNKPLANDALMEDAIEVSISKIKNVEIIRAERFCLGFLFKNTLKKFDESLQEADIIISKGQNHLETLIKYSENFKEKDVFFILKLKCDPLAELMKVSKGDSVIKHVIFQNTIH